mgnify:CR=1 FL=1
MPKAVGVPARTGVGGPPVRPVTLQRSHNFPAGQTLKPDGDAGR